MISVAPGLPLPTTASWKRPVGVLRWLASSSVAPATPAGAEPLLDTVPLGSRQVAGTPEGSPGTPGWTGPVKPPARVTSTEKTAVSARGVVRPPGPGARGEVG